MIDAKGLAFEEFGSLKLGDGRRECRARRMLHAVAKQPSGLVSEVFKDKAELQGAYDFLRNDAIRSQSLLDAIDGATAARCEGEEFVYVVVDGTSLTLTDRANRKPLGPIGASRYTTRGLKVVDAVAVGADGVMRGLLDVQIWARTTASKTKRSRHRTRRLRETEMRYWSRCVDASTAALATHAPDVQPWFVMDREADEAVLLRDLSESSVRFTIRAAQNRNVLHHGRETKLFGAVRSSKIRCARTLRIGRTPKRAARTARVEIRATRVTVRLPRYVAQPRNIEMNVVEVFERSARSDRVHWVLLTSMPVDTVADIDHVISSYATRWRIEEFHRAWKSGGCGVEDIQLQNAEGIRKWAIMLGTVATRTERLRQLSRTTPDAPATIEFTETELAALIVAKRRIKTRVEEVPDGIPTIRTAVRWVGDLGGFSGHYKGYEPGTKVLTRGLEDLAIWTAAFIALGKPQQQKAKKR